MEHGKPFFLDPTRRHATTPWKGERVVLVAYTVNTLGKELEHEFQSLEALGFPLPASVRLPLTEQQDVRRLDAFECFEEEPLQEVVEARHPDGKTSEFAPGTVLKGGGWKETQTVEAGTVELEVSWNLKHSPDQRRTRSVVPRSVAYTSMQAEGASVFFTGAAQWLVSPAGRRDT